MAVMRGADGCARVTRDPLGIPTEAIPACKPDDGATGKEKTITTSNSASHPLEDFDALTQPSNHGRAATQKGLNMKIVVIGGSGLIGSKLVTKLRERGHEAVAASPNSGVNTLTGQGLAAALEGASVVTDVSNAPCFEDAAVLEFFQTSTRNLLAAEATAGVRHHVALSVVGAERPSESGYMRAKIAQEKLIEDSPVPTRSSTRHSSSSSSAASPTPPPAATRCAWHTCSSSPWPPRTWPARSQTSPSALAGHRAGSRGAETPARRRNAVGRRRSEPPKPPPLWRSPPRPRPAGAVADGVTVHSGR
jgi:hypothetical protein